MPTIRSEFTIEQLEKAFQKFAHEQPEFRSIRTKNMKIEFRHDMEGRIRAISVSMEEPMPGTKSRWHDGPEMDYWGFTVERKIYLDSNHSTKVSTGSLEEKEKIMEMLNKVLGGEKPEPRFSLSKHERAIRRSAQKRV